MAIDVKWGAATHQGRVRAQNEDAILSGPTVFAVADGMGGHAAGEVASATAIAALASLDPARIDVDAVTDVLADANAEILRRGQTGEGTAGMGTTVAGVALAGGTAVVFNLGDSRVYLARGGALQQLTQDHSLVAELVADGRITREEARTHTQRNVVTRALGVDGPLEPHIVTVEPQRGDCFVVCSDGLFNEIDEGTLLELATADGPTETRAVDLLHAALASGARDNVSVVLAEIAGTIDAEGLDDDTKPSTVPGAVPTETA